MSFSKDIKKFSDKAEKAALMVFRGTALDIFSKIIRRTPVKTGRLRGNWQTSINAPLSGQLDNATGQKALSSAKSQSGRANIGDSIYMMNNLPYAGVIEDGRSNQAPAGMMKVTIAEFKSVVDAKARQT